MYIQNYITVEELIQRLPTSQRHILEKLLVKLPSKKQMYLRLAYLATSNGGKELM